MKRVLQRKKITMQFFLVFILSFMSFIPEQQAQTQVGWWKMDEGSGTTLIDATVNGNNGAINGTPTWVSGVINSALSIDGTNQYATVPDAASLDITGAITLAAWIKPNAIGTQYIIKKAFSDDPGSAHVNGYELSLTSGGNAFVRFNQLTGPDTYKLVSTNPLPSDGNTWTHVAATFDGSTIRLYINGVLNGSIPGPASISNNNLALGIGTEPGLSLYRFNGAIDDARVYDYALDGTAISGLATVQPTAPVLRSPASGTTDLTIPIILKWFAAASATSYGLKVSTASDLSNPVYEQSGLTTLSALISGLSEYTLYYWGVDATNSVGTTSSSVWNFTTSVALPATLGTGSGFALNLNGTTGNYLTIPDNNTLDLTSTLTIEIWVKPNATTTQRLVRKGNSSGYELFLSSSGSTFDQKVSFRLNGSSGPRLNSTTIYPTDGSWIHIAGTFSGGLMKLYINGLQEGGNLSSSDMVANTAILVFGANDGGGERFNGNIDEIRIWNIARTQAEIQAYMCKKLTGSEPGLIGYWRFDETSGDTYSDETSNNFTTTLVNSTGAEHVWSGAPLGDASAYDYTGSGGTFSATLSHTDGDNLIATTTSGTITGIQVYRADGDALNAISTIPSGWASVDPLRFWGVKVFGTSTPTYTVVYDYNGHPGLGTETDLGLAERSNFADPNWVDAGATLDDVAKTLTVTGQTGTEFALGSTSSPLPVELNTFSASVLKDGIKLSWHTETEVRNYGFEVQRSEDRDQTSEYTTLGFVEGSGSSNSPKDYSFTDGNVTAGKYSYRLKQIDTDGRFTYSKAVDVVFGTPLKFELSQNYPNPFNPVTTINYSIPRSGNVKLTVFNILGQEVAQLVSGFEEAGVHTVNFDAVIFNSGLFLYKIESNGLVQTKKMLLIK